MSTASDLRALRLLEVGRTLVTELDLAAVLDRVLKAAREITGARYAALGILNDRRTELAQFLTSGVEESTRAAIGALPRGRGVLGVLIEHPEPLRLRDVGEHPLSYGFPDGHPVMRGFLGVPISVRGQIWGNLYLADKGDGDFSEHDEEAVVILADWAAVAIDNARLYEVSEHRRQELERAVRGLEATRDVALAIGGQIQLDPVLQLIAKRGRALVAARSLLIMLCEGAELVVRARAGHVHEGDRASLPIAGSTCGQVLQRRLPERIVDVESSLVFGPSLLGVEEARTALLVPMLYRGEPMGVLAAFDRGEQAGTFTAEDEQMLGTFAASAGTAVAMAQSVQEDRLVSSLAAADAERRRWARELHDETLQGLGGLRLLLSSALKRNQLEPAQQAMREAVERIEQEIANLRSIITELRPAALDELGLRTALESLLDRQRERSGLAIEQELELPGPTAGPQRFDEALEMAVYRLVQEALTNVLKHAEATRVRVAVRESDGEVLVEVADDGAGFDIAAAAQGFGLAGMRERVLLAGGTLRIESGETGTVVRARLPLSRRGAGDARVERSAAEKSAS